MEGQQSNLLLISIDFGRQSKKIIIYIFQQLIISCKFNHEGTRVIFPRTAWLIESSRADSISSYLRTLYEMVLSSFLSFWLQDSLIFNFYSSETVAYQSNTLKPVIVVPLVSHDHEILKFINSKSLYNTTLDYGFSFIMMVSIIGPHQVHQIKQKTHGFLIIKSIIFTIILELPECVGLLMILVNLHVLVFQQYLAKGCLILSKLCLAFFPRWMKRQCQSIHVYWDSYDRHPLIQLLLRDSQNQMQLMQVEHLLQQQKHCLEMSKHIIPMNLLHLERMTLFYSATALH